MSAEQLGQPWLVEGQAALGERGDLLRVVVDADHLEAELGHAGSVGGTEVAGADDADPRDQPVHGSSVRTAAVSGRHTAR